jgi:hypothetical protein
MGHNRKFKLFNMLQAILKFYMQQPYFMHEVRGKNAQNNLERQKGSRLGCGGKECRIIIKWIRKLVVETLRDYSHICRLL